MVSLCLIWIEKRMKGEKDYGVIKIIENRHHNKKISKEKLKCMINKQIAKWLNED